MGSLGDINLLEYLRSKTRVDVDSLDVDGNLPCFPFSRGYGEADEDLIEVAVRLGLFEDCTSNQVA